MFVDDYSFQSYKDLGLKSFLDVTDTEGLQMAAPDMGGFGGWLKYLGSAFQLAPIEKGSSGMPEGVLRNGATFVVKGDDIVYQWNDRVPGDNPALEEVMQFVAA